MWLTRFSLSRPVVTLMVFLALFVFGLIAYFQIGRSQNPPGTQFPLVLVEASYPGASPQDMEKLVVKPIEDQIDGIDNLDQMTANAQEGQASIAVQFQIDTDLDKAAIEVQNRVNQARVYLPSDLDPPTVRKNGSQSPLLSMAVSSTSLSPTRLADVVNNQLIPALKLIPNVQSVSAYGQQTREFHVEPIPSRLIGLGATVNDVFGAVAANNVNLPGGLISSPTQETTVSVLANINGASDLARVPLTIPGVSRQFLHVGDIADVSDGYQDQRLVSRFEGLSTVNIDLNKVLTADEITSTAIARQSLKGIEAQFPQLTFREMPAAADYTAKTLDGVWQSLIEGIILTAIVMMLFLHAWRNALVVMIAIPASIFSTFVVMKALGFTFDFMSLMGLSLIIGILVDDSIVVLENITRHRDLGEDPISAAVNGRSEIGGAAVAITMVDVIVFLPIAFLPGIVGKYLKEFALVIVVATLFSLLISFTLTPLLAGRWSVLKRSGAPPRWMDALKHPWTFIGLIAAAVVLFVAPWTYAHVIGIILVALTALNIFVQHYDRILSFYHDTALPAALSHGYFIVFLCGMLVINALMLVVSGQAPGVGRWLATGLDVFVMAALVAGLGLGLICKRGAERGRLEPNRYTEGARGFGGIIGLHVLAMLWVPVRRSLYLAAYGNFFKFLGRSAAGMWTNKAMTSATFAIPLVLAVVMPVLDRVSTDFVPSTQTGSISMTLSYPVGTPIATTAAYVDKLNFAIMKIDGIDTVSSNVGFKQTGYGSTNGGNYATINAETKPDYRSETNAIIEKIRRLTYLAPGGDLEVSGAGGGGTGAQIFYALQGPDAELNTAANKVVTFLKNTPGSVNVQSSIQSGAPRLNVQIDPEKAALLGVSPADAAFAARVAVGGAIATKVRTSDGLVNVRVQFPDAERNKLDAVKNLNVRAGDGTMVPLSSVATFTYTTAPTVIDRLNRERVVNVTGGVLPTYVLGDVTGPLERKLGEPGFLPNGVHLEAQGDTQYANQTIANMLIALTVSFMLVYMLMVILYGSFLEPLIVMFSVPMAIVGALVALALMHVINPQGPQSLNLISMIGIIMLFGLVAKNGILLVDYSNTLVKRGMRVRDAVPRAASTRFRPILMTTFAMVFGMMPLALGFAEGAEWRQSIGTVIIGGLMSSLILTLFLVPLIYNTWMGFFERLGDRRAVAAELQAPVAAAT